jgi:hypothetical protein
MCSDKDEIARRGMIDSPNLPDRLR